MFEKTIAVCCLAALAVAAPRRPAPAIEARDAHGAMVRLSAYRGKVVLVNFWATWCHGCKVEIPWLIDLESRYKGRGFVVIGVSMDENGWAAVKPFVAQKGINYPVILGTTEISKSYGVDPLPETFLIGRGGRIAMSHTGLMDRGDLEREVADLVR